MTTAERGVQSRGRKNGAGFAEESNGLVFLRLTVTESRTLLVFPTRIRMLQPGLQVAWGRLTSGLQHAVASADTIADLAEDIAHAVALLTLNFDLVLLERPAGTAV